MRSVKHGGKKGMRYRYKISAVKRQNIKQKRKLRKIAGCSTIDKAWNKNLTTRQNMAALGLAYDPNEAVKMKSEKSNEAMEMDIDGDVEVFSLEQAKALGNVKVQRKAKKKPKDNAKGVKSIGIANTTLILDELEQIALHEVEEAAKQKKRRRERAKLQPSDIEFCQRMRQKHGEDYEAMARDALNIGQNTPRQIERKIAVYKRTISEGVNKY